MKHASLASASGVQQAVQHPHPPPGGASRKYDWSLPGGRAQLAPPGQLETFFSSLQTLR